VSTPRASDPFPIDTRVVLTNPGPDQKGVWIVRRWMTDGTLRLSRDGSPLHGRIRVAPGRLRYASAAEIAGGPVPPAARVSYYVVVHVSDEEAVPEVEVVPGSQLGRMLTDAHRARQALPWIYWVRPGGPLTQVRPVLVDAFGDTLRWEMLTQSGSAAPEVTFRPTRP
jgi:hypothetical protein